MAGINKKIVAREWLYLVGGAVAGLLLLRMTISWQKDDGDIWMPFLAQYVLFQIVRSIQWAVKTISAK